MLDQENNRLKKLFFLKKNNIEPYPKNNIYITNNIKDIKKRYILKKKIYLVGRIINIINIGKIFFLKINDFLDYIQLYIKINNIKNIKGLLLLKNNILDIGDIIYIYGFLFKTKINIITINVLKIKLLCKCLKVLPYSKKSIKGNVYNKFSNIEKIYRYRYIDLLVNNFSKKNFYRRFKIFKYIRTFLNKKKFIEVETPILHPIYGGAEANPFITYHLKNKEKIYLRIANEIYLKKILVGGFNRIYEFSKNFRNESIDKIHNPEFTMLELYITYKNYYWMMNFCKKFLLYICKKLYNTYKIKYKKNIINFKKPFIIKTIYEIIYDVLKIKIKKINLKKLIFLLKKLDIKVKKDFIYNKDNIILKIFEKKCQKTCIQPTIIIDYFKNNSPLTRNFNNNKNLVERFELFICGYEIANSYTELNNPFEQIKRLEIDKKIIDNDFINSLKIGMPPTTGIGIGIDRLIMLLTNSFNIQNIILFPQMKTF
ncbi:MAG: lysine--tRNA ligase [Candidatus Shikimatogenerans sp. Tduv]|uniref:lysine--tRNA ligase n=1 Tax=Candidatus Shikimatogenerans sp. Tduv TaxID=3158567 RepID=A0AAU7QQX0_9FLAO